LDPLFADADGPDDDPDTWADNDLRVASGSPCIDAGDNTAVPGDAADLDGDGDTGERMPYDLDGQPRFLDDPLTADTGVPDPPDYPDVVDMGAYEFLLCHCGDIDGSVGTVGLGDFATFAACYGYTAPNPPYCTDSDFVCSDLDGSGAIGLADFATFATLYGLPPHGTPPDCIR
jgi:hypothetical protein